MHSLTSTARKNRLTAAATTAMTAVALLTVLTAAPASAAPTSDAPSAPIVQAFDQSLEIMIPQTLTVSADVTRETVVRDTYGVEAPPPASPAVASSAAARQTIVDTAMSYMGVRYVLGGASYNGIDCSGLTKMAYAAVGIDLFHYVPNQNAAGRTIPASEAKPGDLVVFDNNNHIGIYLGGTSVIHAPAPGQNVTIRDNMFVSAYHFVRVLND